MIAFAPDEKRRIKSAYRALDKLMDKYSVDIRTNGNEFWFEVREYNEPEKPELRIV